MGVGVVWWVWVWCGGCGRWVWCGEVGMSVGGGYGCVEVGVGVKRWVWVWGGGCGEVGVIGEGVM